MKQTNFNLSKITWDYVSALRVHVCLVLYQPVFLLSVVSVAVTDTLQLGVHCAPAGLAAILSLIIVTRSKPPSPPSASADEDSIPFVAGIKQVQYCPLLLTVCFLILFE